MSARRLTVPLLAVTALGLGGLTTGPVAASEAASDSDRADAASCMLRVQRVRVLDLQHDQAGGVDDVFARIGNSRTNTRSFDTPRQSRNFLGEGTELFSTVAQVTLRVENAAGGSTRIGSTRLPCEDANPKLTFDNGDARYKIKPLVQVQP